MNAVATFVQGIKHDFETTLAKEHAYRPALKVLLESIEDGITAVNDAKRLLPDSVPDFVLVRHQVPIAYVEAKDIDVDLDRTEKTEQMERYRRDLPNLILTNYLEFRWYRGGEQQQTVSLGELRRKKLYFDEPQFGAVNGLLRDFITASFPDVKSARQLAQVMASMTRRICELIEARLPHEDSVSLKAQKAAFEQTLIPHLTDREFADMYAQTIAYGLFAARVNYQGKIGSFTRRGVSEDIPKTNPFLKRLFSAIMDDLDAGVSWMVDTLIQLLAHTDTDEILKDFGKGTWQNDPVLHFYETFLAAYDPALREKRGVYYTPEPVVSYIVRSVDHLLRTRFNRSEGLANKDTMILDPATGTGTFLYSVIQRIHEGFVGQEGIWNDYVKRHLLPRIFGFELLIAPYTVAHMKMGILLGGTGYKFEGGGRLGIYLTNTLEETAPEGQAGFNQFIVQEANEATAVKRDKKIMVVLGNPPYSNFGQLNQGNWITDLMKDWKPEGEKKWNPDDYMRFIRFGQWRIEKTGQGILAFITNHSFLNGVTHRQMRQSLRNTFSEIYILDLHGNTRKREVTPDSLSDENVFDIQQGVSISLFIKIPGKHGPANIYHADLWGQRREKYEYLQTNDVSETEWKELTNVDQSSCLGSFYFFTPKGFSNIEEYCQGWTIEDIFSVHQNGIKTDRDELFFDMDQKTLEKRIQDLYSDKGLSASFIEKYNVTDSSSYSLLSRRQRTSYNKQNIRTCLYRPFDTRWLYYDRSLTSRPAWEIIQHMMSGSNLALIATRQTNDKWDVHTTTSLLGHKSVAAYDINSGFPLYLYRDPNIMELPGEDEFPYDENGRRPNLSLKFVREMEAKLGLRFISDGKGDLETTFGTEDVFNYAYAVFHSPTYRDRYAEFLKIDFPRLPLTSDKDLFRALCIKGGVLVDLHLLRGDLGSHLITTFPASGDNQVAAGYPKYDSPRPEGEVSDPVGQGVRVEGRVYINPTQYFGGIEPETWDFHAGGYQVLEKWLKDRRGRTLTYDDIQHYQRVVVALEYTRDLMEQIDDLIPSWPLE